MSARSWIMGTCRCISAASSLSLTRSHRLPATDGRKMSNGRTVPSKVLTAVGILDEEACGDQQAGNAQRGTHHVKSFSCHLAQLKKYDFLMIWTTSSSSGKGFAVTMAISTSIATGANFASNEYILGWTIARIIGRSSGRSPLHDYCLSLSLTAC